MAAPKLKTFTVVYIEKDLVDLVDNDKKNVRIMVAEPEQFSIGEEVTEEDFYIQKCLVCYEDGLHSQELAFRIQQY